MKLVEPPPFKLCEEVIETIKHFAGKSKDVEVQTIYDAIGKSYPYVKKAIEYLSQINVITIAKSHIKLRETNADLLVPISIIKKSITEFEPFREFLKLTQSGKSEKTALKLLRTSYSVTNDVDKIKTIFEKKLAYLNTEIPIIPEVKNRISSIPNENNFFWIDESGHLVYDEKSHTQKIINELELKRFKNPAFIDQARIDTLKKITSHNYDLSKLIRLCEEINDAHRVGNYLTVGVLTRSILDHIPPIFGKKNFAEVANNHGGKSFKDIMAYLENFTRKIADSILHNHIRKKEVLLNSTTVDCRTGLDVLLGEIVNELA